MEENEKPKRGRPKGSKNRPKETVESVVSNQNGEPGKIDNAWRQANNYMLPVENVDWGKNKSLLGFVDGFGDWDFGILPPFFTKKRVLGEKINHAFVSLFPNGKPKHLLLFGCVQIGPNHFGPEKDVSFYFQEGEWSEEDIWMEP